MLSGNLNPKLVKRAAEITVNTFENNMEKYCEQIWHFDRKAKQKIESDYYVLRTQYEFMYRKDMGLQFHVKENEKEDENSLFFC